MIKLTLFTALRDSVIKLPSILLAPFSLFLVISIIPFFSISPREAAAQESNASLELREIVVTATRNLRNLRDVSSSVSVVDSEVIEKNSGSTVLDALKSAAGVSVLDDRGSYGSSTSNKVVIRGMGGDGIARVIILVDGLPSVSAGSGNFEWNGINPNFVERIEILRGPSSALYGSNAMGGVVNIITKDPDEGTSQTSFSSRFGKYNTVESSILRSENRGKIAYTLSAGYAGTHGFNAYPRRSPSSTYVLTKAVSREETVKNYTAALKLRYNFDEKTSLTFSADANDYSRTGRYQGGQFDARDYNLYLHKHLSFMTGLTKDFGFMDSRAGLRLDLIDNDYDSGSARTLTFTNSSPNKVWQWNFDQTNVIPLDFQTITFGMTGYFGHQARSYLYFANPATVRKRGGHQISLGFFLQDEISLFDNKVILSPGLRYDYWRTKGYDYNSQINSFDDYDWMVNTYLSPKLGVRYDPLDGFLIIRANYGEGFRVGTLDDRFGSYPGTNALYIGSNDLDPESSRSVDLGFEIVPSDKISLSLTGFYTKAKNYIDSVPIDPTPYPDYATVFKKMNIGKVKIYGLESSVNFYPTSYLNLFANGNITKSVVADGENEGHHIDNTPQSKLSLGADFDHPGLFSLRVAANYTGRIWQNVSEDERLAEGKLWLFDARLSKKFFLSRFTLEPFVEFDNITTEKEVRLTNSSRSPINMYYAGLRFDF
jgi:outer membrane receptor protein involved in Fe transport